MTLLVVFLAFGSACLVIAKRRTRGIVAIVLFLASLPTLLAMGGMGAAQLAGCTIEGGGVIPDSHPCLMAGLNVSGLLNLLMFCGWFIAVTVPLSAIFLLIYSLTKAWRSAHSNKQKHSVHSGRDQS